MQLTFQQQTALQQLKAIESSSPFCSDRPVTTSPSATCFNQWLIQRLESWKKQSSPTANLVLAKQLYHRAVSIVMMLCFLLGGFSAFGLISSEQQQVNVFWLLGALLGGHSVALLLWLLVILRPLSSHNGPLGSILQPLAHAFFNQSRNPAQSLANLAWWQVQFSNPLRIWRFSGFSHLAWLCFLSGSLLGLLTLLSTQRYDFVWESTLISEQRFLSIVHMLSTPLTLIGLPSAPSMDSLQTDAEQLRKQWAWFTINCLVLYGCLPRLLALLVARAMLLLRQHQWKIDYSDDYYIQLRSQFEQEAYPSRIIDQDDAPPSDEHTSLQFASTQAPQQAPWYGLEVNPDIPWDQGITQVKGVVSRHQDIQELAQRLRSADQDYVIFVEGQRLPDRGVQRNLSLLSSNRAWLVVTYQNTLAPQQAQAWLKAAHQSGYNNQYCIAMEVHL